MVRRSVPASSMCVAKLCRSVCGPIRLVNPARKCSFMAGVPHDFIGDGALWLNRLNPAGKQVNAWLVPASTPILSQGLEQLRGERQIAVARSLPLMHVNDHQGGVDIADLQPRR